MESTAVLQCRVSSLTNSNSHNYLLSCLLCPPPHSPPPPDGRKTSFISSWEAVQWQWPTYRWFPSVHSNPYLLRRVGHLDSSSSNTILLMQLCGYIYPSVYWYWYWYVLSGSINTPATPSPIHNFLSRSLSIKTLHCICSTSGYHLSSPLYKIIQLEHWYWTSH